jgi:hypothetical protein
MAKQGKTTGNLKMRSGPGMQFDPPIAYLVPDTALEILGEDGDWWKVRAAGKEGYVGKKYVAVTETPAPAEGAKSTEDMTKGRTGTTAVRAGAKPAPAKGIQVDASSVEPRRAAKPEPAKPSPARPGATKASTVRTTVTRPGMPKPKAPPSGSKKK